MSIPVNLVYLIGTIPGIIIWLILFLARKDLRKESLIMGTLIGVLSVATSYYWWTFDWWQPPTLFGTRVGIEDFIVGFTTGGIMATAYEVLFKRRFSHRKINGHNHGAIIPLLLLAQITSWAFWGLGLTTFWASTIAMILVSTFILYLRKDLIRDAIYSAILMMIASLPLYYTIILIHPKWIDLTFNMPGISGFRPLGIPIEDLAFWLLAGFLFGPFYEYWQGKRLKSLV